MALGFLVMLSGAGFAKDRPQISAGPRLRISLRVQDYAQVAPKILTQAKREAAAILDETGIETIWVDCPPKGRPTEAVCAQAFTATELALRILPQAMAAQVPLNGDVFGFAAVSTDERPSLVASVFYQRVEALSSQLGYSRASTLGYVMAHEIGHLLLGTNSHSPRGIMRARLAKEDFLRPLGFSAPQADLLRTEVRRRVAVAASAEAAGTVQAASR